MNAFVKNTEDIDLIKIELSTKPWLVACLCAAWCNTCQSYRAQFDALSAKHPDKCFAWIDIEDQAELVDALDIENFPTILIEYQNSAVFFGTMLPDVSQVERLLSSFEASVAETDGERTLTKSTSFNQNIPHGWSLGRLILSSK